MKAKHLINGTLIAVILSFISSFVNTINLIGNNHYVQYRAVRLTATFWQENWNQSVLAALGLMLVLYGFWYLTVKQMKFDKGKILSFMTITLVGLLSIHWVLQHFFGHTFWSIAKKFVDKISAIRAGTISMNDFLGLLSNNMIFIIIVGVGLVAMWPLFVLLTKLNWTKISRIVTSEFIRRTGIILVVLLLLLNIGVVIDKNMNSAKGPNVILISVETLRPDHLSCYGYERNTSPNIDKFAEESVLYEHCYAHAPSTGPSCSAFLSGFLPHETKVLDNSMRFPLGVWTLAERLKEGGYRTCGVVSNYVLRRHRNFHQGFDDYDDKMDQKELTRGMPERIAENTTASAIKILKRQRAAGFFMWIHYQDPHGPYTPRKPYDSLFFNHNQRPKELKFNDSVSGLSGIPSYQRLDNHNDFHHYVAQYDGEIRYFDEHFGRLIKALKELGLYDTSLIIFTADHGEAMGEENCFFAHGHSLHNNQIHVPLMIRYGSVSSGRRSDLVQHIDIVPTILKIVGIPTEFRLRGRNLLAPHVESPIIYSEMRLDRASVIVDGFKLVMDKKRTSLYDIGNDPFEQLDLSQSVNYLKHLIRLMSALQRLRNEDFIGEQAVVKLPVLTEEERQKLRSLGYIE